MFYIGHKCLFEGREYHIQDVNRIDYSICIGEADENGLIWEPFWVFTKDCQHIA